METIIQPPQWPLAFSNFVTWCLMWDPKNRPTSRQAMDHEFFADAVDPLRPKSSSRLLGRKHSDLSFRSKESSEVPTITSKPSWFRRSLIARESAPAVPQHDPSLRPPMPVPTESDNGPTKVRPPAGKRATWQAAPPVGAPMPILPSIKPVSPVPNNVNAQANSTLAPTSEMKSEVPRPSEEKSKKIGRQLSVNSHGNHYADTSRQEAERALNGNSGLASPPAGGRESFFSHLRKRARRFSGRHGLASPGGDDIEANAASVPWSNRSSMIVDNIIPEGHTDFFDLDKALQNVRYSLDRNEAMQQAAPESTYNSATLKRTHSLQRSRSQKSADNLTNITTPAPSRTRRALQISNPVQHYETPAEEDELLDEALTSAHRAARRLNAQPAAAENNVLMPRDYNRQYIARAPSNPALQGAYLTPSPSANRDGVQFGYSTQTPSKPLNINKQRPDEHVPSHWPTPPYEENEWASSAAASIFAAGSSIYR